MIESMVNSPAAPSQRAAAQQPHIEAEDRKQAKTSDKEPNRISDQQYMSAFSQYKIYCVSMAPRVYTSQQIAYQINQIKTTVFKDKNIPDVTEDEVSELRNWTTQNRDDKRAAYAKFKQDRNRDTLSTKMAALNKSAGERLGRLGVTVGKSLDSLKAKTKEKMSESASEAGKRFDSLRQSASDAASEAGKRFTSLRQSASDAAPNLTFSFGKKSAVDESAANTPPPPSRTWSPPPPYQPQSIFPEKDDDPEAPPLSREARSAKALSSIPANLFDDNDDHPLVENSGNDSSTISSNSQPLDKKIQYMSPTNKVLFNVSVIANVNGTFTLSFDKPVSSGTLIQYMTQDIKFSEFDEFEGTGMTFVTTGLTTKARAIIIRITVNRSVYDTFCRDVLDKKKEWKFTLSKDSKKVVIPGTWVSKKQSGGKRKRTIKRKHRSIRYNTLRSKK
jgi:hypothetical protein